MCRTYIFYTSPSQCDVPGGEIARSHCWSSSVDYITHSSSNEDTRVVLRNAGGEEGTRLPAGIGLEARCSSKSFCHSVRTPVFQGGFSLGQHWVTEPAGRRRLLSARVWWSQLLRPVYVVTKGGLCLTRSGDGRQIFTRPIPQSVHKEHPV